MLRIFLLGMICFVVLPDLHAGKINWSKTDDSFFTIEEGEIVRYSLPGLMRNVIVKKSMLQVQGQSRPINVESFEFSNDLKKVLLYTNSKKVWRYNTRGDYWLLNLSNQSLTRLGMSRPASSLMFAKLSPDGSKAAYVSEYNIYLEDLVSGNISALTTGGTNKLINGTFDWAYEEEFFCRDGFRWSPDSKKIAYWQIDARKVKNYLMVNNTDSLYPRLVPVEYPIAGEPPSPFKIGVVDISGKQTKWMDISTDPVLQSYVPRMEWAANNSELIIQHVSRRQNHSELQLCNVTTGSARTIYTETDSAWLDVLQLWDEDYAYGGWDWLDNGKNFLWASEKDGWRHLYIVSRDGRKETLITKGNFDVIDINSVSESSGYVYYLASPANATQKYLYRSRLSGEGTPERLSPLNQPGTHTYDVAPTGNFAYHTFTNSYTRTVSEWVSVPGHKPLKTSAVNDALAKPDTRRRTLEFFTIRNAAGIEMDAWMIKPVNFDSAKKYPVVFYVYTEPGGQTVKDEYGTGNNHLYNGNMAADGYIYISIDNRGTPAPKGSAWRKSAYRKVGQVNIADQAAAARQILQWPFVDTSRVAVWGWSGGGSATLNLMFQYPDIYKVGIAIAAVGSQFTYDNIYQERYMGLPQDNKSDFVKGSPVTYAKNYKGKLLYIHGTGDDNVHYQNAELLINEMIRYNKQFRFMAYPNRTHNISEGEGTHRHLATLFTEFLKETCPPGAR